MNDSPSRIYREEVCQVSYEISGRIFISPINEARTAAQVLLTTQDKTARIFSRIVISRSLTELYQKPISKELRISHPQVMVAIRDSQSIDDFISMMNYDTSLNQDEWMNFFTRFQSREKEGKDKS